MSAATPLSIKWANLLGLEHMGGYNGADHTGASSWQEEGIVFYVVG